MTRMKRKMKYIPTCLLFLFLLLDPNLLHRCNLHLSNGVQGLDIGGALKNLVRSPDLSDVVDASTGTILATTSSKDSDDLSSTNRKPTPVTCDDLMAQAVVLSNEQKMIALSDRDAAVVAAANATLSAQNWKVKHDTIQEEMERVQSWATLLQQETVATIEKTRMDAEIFVNTTLAETQERITSIQNQSRQEIESIQHKMETLMNETILQAKEDVANIQLETENEIRSVKKEAEERVAAIIKSTTEENQQIRTNAEELVHQIEIKMQQLELDTQQQIKDYKASADQEIVTILEQSKATVENITRNAEEMEKQARDEITKAIAEKDRTITRIEKETKDQIMNITHSSMENIERITREKNSEIASMMEKLENEQSKVSELNFVRESLEMELKNTSVLLKEALQHNQDLDVTISTLQDQLKDVHELIRKTNAEKMDLDIARQSLEMELKNTKILLQEARQHNQELDMSISTLQDQLKDAHELIRKQSSEKMDLDKVLKDKEAIIMYWESKPQGYINSTLVREDLRTYYHLLRSNAVDLSNYSYTIVHDQIPLIYSHIITSFKFFSNNLIQFTKRSSAKIKNDGIQVYLIDTMSKLKKEGPRLYSRYRKTLNPIVKKVGVHYKKKLSPFVDSYVAPSFNSYVKPFYSSHIIPIFRVSQKVTRNQWKNVVKKTQQMRSFVILKTKETAIISLRYSSNLNKAKGHLRVPAFMISAFTDIRDNPKFFVDSMLLMITLVLVYKSRNVIRGIISLLVMVPLRTIWFFCPLRLFLPYSKTKTSDGNGTNGTASTTRNPGAIKPKVEGNGKGHKPKTA